jgi:hypothetical protein
MKRNAVCTWTLLGFLLATAGAAGCAREISHSESDKPDWIGGGRTHTESTVYQNPDGSISTESSRQTTK